MSGKARTDRDRERWRLAQARKREREAVGLGRYPVEMDRVALWRGSMIASLMRAGKAGPDGTVAALDIAEVMESFGDPDDATLAAHASLLLREHLEQLEACVADEARAVLAG
jgi:hypothetical protein